MKIGGGFIVDRRQQVDIACGWLSGLNQSLSLGRVQQPNQFVSLRHRYC